MSKQQAILQTLLGAAELSGNLTLIDRLRHGLEEIEDRRRSLGYERLSAAAGECKRIRSKAA
jgi:hypothetical protein